MTIVQVMPEDDRDSVLERTTDPAVIAGLLAPYGITLRQWQTRELAADAGQEEVIAAYRTEIDEVCAAGGYRLVDVVRMVPDPDSAQWREQAVAARAKFLNEHRHAEDEVRFFVEGRGCFYLHLGDKVYAVVCERGDLISVPAGTTHWFDMGASPEFCAIRFFEREDGWIGDFTGDEIGSRMPNLDELLA
ncbi:cupin domain-containing protein [Nocardia sp. NPDC005978]|uniref:1,2-dihydroxy-3-keto-5-methylthiopentene dioxygenase n=1 Tax=unclassified Nocardia TaxID=2637762 RepID=UPI0033BB3CC5